jgi:hypothetical protein
MAFTARAKYSEFTSNPILPKSQAEAAATVEPDPINGSRMIPSPRILSGDDLNPGKPDQIIVQA